MENIVLLLICTIFCACINRNKNTDQTTIALEYEVLFSANTNISVPEYQILGNDHHPDAQSGKQGNRECNLSVSDVHIPVGKNY
ncbi:hypothetical protein [Parabacteroides bouchesdurhonensis]|uniref:hypothetical protein n=1 Tax=Parabacteroides bouchesdurhonensis TaxID=1936995 RepID=UPI000C82B3D0|nr:hypothetical protein [Parabacteroides bouchesdurhonensis]